MFGQSCMRGGRTVARFSHAPSYAYATPVAEDVAQLGNHRAACPVNPQTKNPQSKSRWV